MKTRDLLALGERLLCQGGLSAEEARREALLALAHLLGKRLPEVYLQPEVPEETRRQFLRMMEERARGVPLAYILGEVEFFGRPFLVSPGVLIPRPETEILIESVLEHVGNRAEPVLELGVGSGCVSLTLALEAAKLRVFGVEKSAAALEVALKNRRRLGLEGKVFFFRGDWLEAVKPRPYFRALVSNPPYVAPEEWASLAPEVREHEPREALLGGRDGLSFIRRTLEEAPRFLRPGGLVFLEIGYRQREKVEELARSLGYDCSFARDLLGHDRVLVAGLRSDRGPSCE